MTSLAFDCFSGIAGDMMIAALVDAGAPLDGVTRGLERLGLPPFSLSTETVTRGGIRARTFMFESKQSRRISRLRCAP